MKVLLTGGSGFVGSHIAELLCNAGIQLILLLRKTSDKSFLGEVLNKAEVAYGSISDPSSLQAAMARATHVIHCAGCTKSVTIQGFFEVNQIGTRNVVNAVNSLGGQIQRLVHISSLAAAGPGTAITPRRESDPSQPVSEYGRSKLAAEQEVQSACKSDYVIVRPPAVYGPRDEGFYSIFQAVSRHILPKPPATQELSLIYVSDLVEGIHSCLIQPEASRQVYFCSPNAPVTGRQIARAIADQMQHWTVPLPLPSYALWPVCAAQGLWSKISNRPNLLSLQKYPELKAPGWVCDSSKMDQQLGFRCKTNLQEGVSKTLKWYKDHQWL